MIDNIQDAMNLISIWKKNRRNIVAPISMNIAYKPTFEADYFREASFYRFIELVEATFSLYNSNLLVASVVTARASHETVAVLWYINSKLEHLTKTKDLKHFTDTMNRLINGWSNDDVFPEKINIFTCIDAVDKVMEGKFRRHYEMLSEYAHPNYSGTFGAYASPNHETHEVEFGVYPRSKETLKNHIESTLIICIILLESIQESYEDVINKALDVCLDLHDEGKLKEQL